MKFLFHLRVTARLPPTFIWHTVNDDIVPVEHSLMFWQACRSAHVPVELHVFESGPHAQGLACDNPKVAGWKTQMLAWLDGWLDVAQQSDESVARILPSLL